MTLFKQELILSELETIANDIKAVVAVERENLEKNKKVKEKNEEILKKDKDAPLSPFTVRHSLGRELNYFEIRLQAVINYFIEGERI